MNKYTQEGININTFKMLFEVRSDLTIDQFLSRGLFEAEFFRYYVHNWRNEILYKIINLIRFPEIHCKGWKKYRYLSKEESFDFILLEKYLKIIFKDNLELAKRLLINYKNAHNPGTCFYSIVLASYLENSYLVVGNMPSKTGESLLHRFVEVNYNGTAYILDIAKNLIIKKSDYYKISGFKEIDRLSSKDVRALYNFGNETKLCNHTGIMTFFGNEILNDLKKNKLLEKKNYSIPSFSSILD